MSRLLWSAPLCGFLIYVFSFHFVLEANDPDLGSYSGIDSFGVSFVPKISLKYPKLDSNLNHFLDIQPGTEDQVEVDIYVSGDLVEFRLYLDVYDGEIISIQGDHVEALVSASLLEQIAGLSDVAFIKTLSRMSPLESTAALPLLRSDVWNQREYEAEGVKVGVIDIGFSELSTLQGSELPYNINFQCYSGSNYTNIDISHCETVTDHGTAVSEIIMDIAPKAELYISNPSTRGGLKHAVEWMVDQEVDVINFSAGFSWDGPGDGTSPYNNSPLATVEYATSNNVLWVSAAGNENGNTWTGEFGLGEEASFHYFDEAYNYNPVYIARNKSVIIQMRWKDSWASPATDLNLYLYDPTLSWSVDSSSDLQTGLEYQDPLETISYQAVYSGDYNVVVHHVSGPVPEWVQVQIFSGNDLHINTGGHSIANPAESSEEALLAVGASSVVDGNEIETFSSRGPTMDGRIKPDIVSYDQVFTSSRPYEFPGTSAAAPHVTGMAVLVRGRFPSYSAAEIAEYLKNNALLMNDSINNVWGHGMAKLPFLPSTKPLNVSVDQQGSSAFISWDAPEHNGGSALSGYRISINPGNVAETVDSGTFEHMVIDLDYGYQYEVTVTPINIQGDGETSQPVLVTVTNSPPVLDDSSILDLNSVESQEFSVTLAYFSDVDSNDTHTASIDWGDGNTSTGVIATEASQKSVSGTHMYIDDGVFSISVEIEDSYGNSSSATVPFTSVNSAPVVSSINSYSWYGTMVMLDIPSFVDLGLNDTHYAILDWGNGATSTAEIIPERRIIADYVYPEAGEYTVSVYVYDDDGGVGTTQLNVSVFEPLTSIAIPGVNFWVLVSVALISPILLIGRKRLWKSRHE
ncbi:S8 family serine peptidase [Dehalococcoidia bacterium]|nr:S8 family serine peptidase [Dehalococcoidia bacterium]